MATPAVITPGTKTGNLFLDSLDAESLATLLPRAEQMDATAGTLVAPPREPIKFVVFPMSCAISVVTRMRDGSEVEAMLVGREGLYGLPVALGNDVSANEAVVQVPGTFLRVSAADFLTCLQLDAALHARVLVLAHA